jgi:predicted amidophosphoribosyltransferase
VKILQSLEELIFPVRCLGCSALGIEICSRCRKDWHPRIIRTASKLSPHFPIYSSIPYSPVAGKVLLAAKESGISSADKLLTDALIFALTFCLDETPATFIVPIPSRKEVARLRGRQFISAIAMQAGEFTSTPIHELLSHVRKVRDQSTLDAKARSINLDGALISRRYISGNAVLIDDLVTTGATLHEAARALRASGIAVAAAVTACVAEPLR